MVGMCCGAEEKPQGSVGLEGGWWWSPRGLHLEVVRGQRSGSRAPLLGSSGRCQVVEAQAVKPGVWEAGCRWARGRKLQQGVGPAQRQREAVPFGHKETDIPQGRDLPEVTQPCPCYILITELPIF